MIFKAKQRFLRCTAVLLCTSAFAVAALYLVPVMQSVQVGQALSLSDAAAAAAPQTAETTASAASDAAASDAASETNTVPILRRQAAAPQSNVITWESESSAAMHNARLYQNPLTNIAGSIVKKHYGKQSGTMFFALDNGGQVRNSTFWNNADLLAESRILPDLDLKTGGTPMVLIYHTHTTESYQETDAGVYDAAYNFRTTEPDRNMVAVGDAIAEQLAAAGIGVVHAEEIHDYPVWNKSYSRSAETIKAILEEYPSICIALDIHRDAITSGTTVYAPVTEIDGKQSAQIMIISGCDDGTMNLPDYRDNFHLASILQQTAETMYAGFTRPIMFDYRKYNQDLTHGSLLIEVGSQGNTLDEATYAGELLGQALSAVILQLAEGASD